MCYNGCCTSLFCEDDDIPECDLCHGSGFIECPSCNGNFDCGQCVDGEILCECSIDDTEPERRETTSAEHEAYLAFITFLGEYNHE